MPFLWKAPDGVLFPYEHWLATPPIRAVLICIPGLGGAAEDFAPLGQAAAQKGIAVYALNLRGQGLDPSPTRRGAWLQLPELEQDLAAFGNEVSVRHPDLPVYWCGESMGSLILCHFLTSTSLSFPASGAIFSVPVVELRKPTPRWMRLLLAQVARYTPNLRFRPSRFVSGKATQLAVTRDEQHLEKLRTAAHHIPAFTIGFLNSFGNVMDTTHTVARQMHLPCLVLSAGCDVFVTPQKVREWYECLASKDKAFQEYPESYHLLWNDLGSDKVLADITSWLAQKVAKTSESSS